MWFLVQVSRPNLILKLKFIFLVTWALISYCCSEPPTKELELLSGDLGTSGWLQGCDGCEGSALASYGGIGVGNPSLELVDDVLRRCFGGVGLEHHRCSLGWPMAVDAVGLGSITWIWPMAVVPLFDVDGSCSSPVVLGLLHWWTSCLAVRVKLKTWISDGDNKDDS
jgi:hypothetical protein